MLAYHYSSETLQRCPSCLSMDIQGVITEITVYSRIVTYDSTDCSQPTINVITYHYNNLKTCRNCSHMWKTEIEE